MVGCPADRRRQSRRTSTTWPPSRWAPSNTAWCAWTNPAKSSEMRCCGTTLAPTGAAAELVDELGGAARMGETHRRGAGRRDHGEQTALARRPRTRTRRRHRRGVPAARLADVAAEPARPMSAHCARTAATPAGPDTSPPNPTPTNTICWSWRCGDGGPRCRRCSARTTPPVRHPAVPRSVPVRATTPRRRWASAPNPATASSRSARPGW